MHGGDNLSKMIKMQIKSDTLTSYSYHTGIYESVFEILVPVQQLLPEVSRILDIVK